jgi:hypothetical protein
MRQGRTEKRQAIGDGEDVHPLDIAAASAPSTREVHLLAIGTEVHLLGDGELATTFRSSSPLAHLPLPSFRWRRWTRQRPKRPRHRTLQFLKSCFVIFQFRHHCDGSCTHVD